MRLCCFYVRKQTHICTVAFFPVRVSSFLWVYKESSQLYHTFDILSSTVQKMFLNEGKLLLFDI